MDKPLVAAARADSVPPGKFVKVAIGGQPYIVANAAGRYYAVEDRCSHEDYPLSFGCLDGELIKCSLHGSRFSLATGEPMDEPADIPIRTFPCVESDGWVWIDIGEA
jgi:3-phenylpropionate/trans-cinnamate dioxygenase ferredoxin subunit